MDQMCQVFLVIFFSLCTFFLFSLSMHFWWKRIASLCCGMLVSCFKSHALRPRLFAVSILSCYLWVWLQLKKEGKDALMALSFLSGIRNNTCCKISVYSSSVIQTHLLPGQSPWTWFGISRAESIGPLRKCIVGVSSVPPRNMHNDVLGQWERCAW